MMIQGSEEWHEFRKTHIGASDAPTIMGENPWKTPYELYLEKIGEKEIHQNHWMKRGSYLEKDARNQYELLTGHAVFPSVHTHPDYKWMSASYDGLSLCNKYAVEIKCGKKAHQYALKNEIPPYYKAQLQHQMFVIGIDEMDYFSFEDNEGIIIPVKRDQEYIVKLIEKELQFYNWLTDRNFPGHLK